MRTAQPALVPDGAELLRGLARSGAGADPYPVYARLRALGPVGFAGAIFLASYDDCSALLRDPQVLSQSPQWCDRVTPGWRAHPAKVATFETMLFRDPPDHTRLRKLISAAFTPRAAQRLRERVVTGVDQALARLADEGAGGGTVDLREVLAASLPIAVIAGLVGVPERDWPLLRVHMSALLALVELAVSDEELARADAAAVALREYAAELAASRRREPRDDLATELVAAREAGACTEDELLQTLTFVFMAGVDTMTNLLANAASALLAHPDQAALLRSRPELAASAAEEVLRYDPPIQFVGRVAGAACDLHGRRLAPGQLVIAILGAANRDPERFTDPDRFDVTRTALSRTVPTVLSFGGGLHYCLGAPLARLEAAMFVSELVRRFPRLRLAGEPRRSGTVFRGFGYLPVALS